MSRIFLCGPTRALDELEIARDLLVARGYDVRLPGAGLAPDDDDTAEDCVDAAAADLDAVLDADMVVTLAMPGGAYPTWQAVLALSVGIPVVPLSRLSTVLPTSGELVA